MKREKVWRWQYSLEDVVPVWVSGSTVTHFSLRLLKMPHTVTHLCLTLTQQIWGCDVSDLYWQELNHLVTLHQGTSQSTDFPEVVAQINSYGIWKTLVVLWCYTSETKRAQVLRRDGKEGGSLRVWSFVDYCHSCVHLSMRNNTGIALGLISVITNIFKR